MSEEKIIEKLREIEEDLTTIRWNFEDVLNTVSDVYDMVKLNNKGTVKDIDNFKRQLVRNNLNSTELEDFIDEYMRYYNK